MQDILGTVLNTLAAFAGNYGLGIILFTVLLKVLLIPLDYASRKATFQMERISPQLQELQKKYANDKTKLQKKQNDLYKQERINPLKGCLPLLISFPILMIMFSTLRNTSNDRLIRSLELLQSSTKISQVNDNINNEYPHEKNFMDSFLWIKNIWLPDTLFIGSLPSSSKDLNMLNTANNEHETSNNQVEELKQFVDGDYYQKRILPHYGSIPVPSWNVNLLFTSFTLYKSPNGLLLLPILCFVTQVLSTAILKPRKKQEGNQQQSGSFLMNWGMPAFFFVICATSSAAFALYWATSNILTLVQNVIFNQRFMSIEKHPCH